MITKHIEIKTYDFGDVKVTVHINYDKKQISLVENTSSGNFTNKHYVFADRSLEYMNGWLNILECMKEAIKQESKELQDYLDKEQEDRNNDVTEIMLKATEMVKNKKNERKTTR